MAVSLRAAALAAAGVLAVALLSPTTAMAWAWLGLVGLACVVDALAAVSPREFGVARSVGSPVRADETTESVVVLRNPGRRGARIEVRDAWPPSAHPAPARHRGALPGRGSVRLVTRLRPERRGTRTADYVTIRVWGPLGLAARQVSVAATVQVSVLPEFRSRRLLPSRLARLREEGSTATILRGPGTEFDSLRDYVRGDDPRDIDWRASARSRDLVVRTWRPERDRHIVVVLDAGRTGALLLGAGDGAGSGVGGGSGVEGGAGSGTGARVGASGGSARRSAVPADIDEGGSSPAGAFDRGTRDPDRLDLGVAPRMDAGIEAALLLAALADRAGDNVHLLAVDRTVRARVSGVRGAALMHRIAESLTDVAPRLEPIDWALVVAEVRRTVHHPGLVVLLTEVPPAGADPDFLQAVADLSARHHVLVASASDPEVARLARPERSERPAPVARPEHAAHSEGTDYSEGTNAEDGAESAAGAKRGDHRAGTADRAHPVHPVHPGHRHGLSRAARALDAASVYESAAASATLREQVAGDDDAARAGATVLDVEAGLLPARLADTYLAMKKQGRL